MKPYRFTMISVAVLLLVATISAQTPPQSPPPATAAAQPAKQPIVPLEVQVVIARYQGEKRVSSMPYTLAVNANAVPATELNMGAEVPIPSAAFIPSPAPAGDAKPANALRSFNYRSIGTNIVARASSADDGRFELTLNIDESSVYTKADGPGGANDGDLPVFRNFRSRNTLLLRDGQVRQYTAATDRASGETFRIEVTLKIVK